MSKYGEFNVVRTERRKPKKTSDRNVGEDGMRDYSILRCPHCTSEDIEIATANLDTQRHPVIRDHMLICSGYMGERPTKRTKVARDVKTCEQKTQTPDEWKFPTSSHPTDENAWLKSENAELEMALTNAQSALKSQREHLLAALKSVDVHREMGFPIFKLDNGLT